MKKLAALITLLAAPVMASETISDDEAQKVVIDMALCAAVVDHFGDYDLGETYFNNAVSFHSAHQQINGTLPEAARVASIKLVSYARGNASGRLDAIEEINGTNRADSYADNMWLSSNCRRLK